MNLFNPVEMKLTKYLFFTGKGGVGKTSAACGTAVALAETGKKVMLVSTDPASNLQDVFNIDLSNKGTEIEEVKGLTVANFDPVTAAFEYKESVVGPFRGVLPDSVIANMEEQLSGSCTVEIAAFNEFSGFLSNPEVEKKYDHVIFDTAPTGHTLRMLQLPSAWNNFMDENIHGASCLGQLSGLSEKKESYEESVKILADEKKTTLMLVTRPEKSPLLEAERASKELVDLDINNQVLIVNGILENYTDDLSKRIYEKQQKALEDMPIALKEFKEYFIPLRSYNVTGIENLKMLFKADKSVKHDNIQYSPDFPTLKAVIDALGNKKVIFTMGKGGVGKTTIAAAIAMGLANKGKKVHLATTDPAAHLKYVISETKNIKLSHIDEEKELKEYQEEVLAKARETMSPEDVDYVAEDLRSPCTQEIAVFRAFAEIVENSDFDVAVIDTAPTGHTLLLLDSTQSYHKEVERTAGEVPLSVQKLLPRLQNKNETEVVMVTLPETTPVYESMRLKEDLDRANMAHTWWVVNNSMLSSVTKDSTLLTRAQNEIEWINKVKELSSNHYAVVSWYGEEMTGKALEQIIK